MNAEYRNPNIILSEWPHSLALMRLVLCSALVVQLLQEWSTFQALHHYLGFSVLSKAISNSWPLSFSFLYDIHYPMGGNLGGLVKWMYLICLLLLLVGFKTRIVATITLLIQVTVKHDSYALAYGADEFATIGLFYCAVLPVGDALSFDSGLRDTLPLFKYGLSYLVLRLHMCIIYLAAGTEKIVGSQWHNGEALWRAIARPSALGEHAYALAALPLVLAAMGWVVVIMQLSYPVLIWFKRTRVFALVSVETFHFGIAVSLGLWIFSALMLAMNLGALVDPAAVRRWIFSIGAKVALWKVVSHMDGSDDNIVIYDEACWACRHSVAFASARKVYGELRLINARSHGPEVTLARKKGFNLSEGMVVRLNGRYYFGSDALALLVSPRSLGVRWLLRITRLYSALSVGRRLLLRWRGISPILD